MMKRNREESLFGEKRGERKVARVTEREEENYKRKMKGENNNKKRKTK